MRKSSLLIFKVTQYFLVGASIVGAFCYFLFYTNNSHKLASKIRSIPKEDRERLEFFFRDLIQEGCVGHTLFGKKPMSCVGFFDPFHRITNKAQKLYSLTTNNVLKKIGLDTWIKYQHLFPSQNFLFLLKKDAEFLEIYLINKAVFLNTVQFYLKDICEKLGKSFTAQEFLDAFIKEEDISGFLKRQSVLGILLGYGKENAELFERLCALKKWNPYFGFSLRNPLLVTSSNFSNIEEELKFIEQNLNVFTASESLDVPIAFMIPLGFRANLSSVETQRLREQYKEECQKIARIYQKGDFLETTLEQLVK